MSQRAAWTRAVERRRAAKYGNVGTTRDGYRFASVLEADRYSELKLLKASGEVLWFTRQVPFAIAPGVTYRADFLVVWAEGAWPCNRWTVEDTKGFLTEAARVKLAAVEQLHGVRVRLLRRGDVQRFA